MSANLTQAVQDRRDSLVRRMDGIQAKDGHVPPELLDELNLIEADLASRTINTAPRPAQPRPRLATKQTSLRPASARASDDGGEPSDIDDAEYDKFVITGAVLREVAQALVKQIRELRRDVVELKAIADARTFKGAWHTDRDYQEGNLVYFGGSLWHANAPTQSKPGINNKLWSIAAKGGK